MKEISITTTFSGYDSLQDLPIDIQNLMSMLSKSGRKLMPPIQNSG